MRMLFGGTPGGKKGAVDGLNLFFGALLGANLGTLDGLRLVDYIQLAVVLAGVVMTLRMVSTSEQEKRAPALVLLAVYALVLVAFAAVPSLKPSGMSAEDLHRLVATLGVWLTFVLTIELSPTRGSFPPPAQPGDRDPS